MPAHIKAALTQTQLSIPIDRGQLVLGTWQAIYLFEHRSSPHRRELVLHLIGEYPYVMLIQRMSCASPIGQNRTSCTFLVNGPNHLVL